MSNPESDLPPCTISFIDHSPQAALTTDELLILNASDGATEINGHEHIRAKRGATCIPTTYSSEVSGTARDGERGYLTIRTRRITLRRRAARLEAAQFRRRRRPRPRPRSCR